jgi:FAD:protein FMN transferase
MTISVDDMSGIIGPIRRILAYLVVVLPARWSFLGGLKVCDSTYAGKGSPIILFCLAAVFPLHGCSNTLSEGRQEMLGGATMGTTFTIRYVAKNNSTAPEEIERLIDLELIRVNQQMSTYLQDSEVSLFNTARSTDWFTVSSETAQVVDVARQISEFSNGAFDVTVAPLINLWGFGPGKLTARVPKESEIDALKKVVGYRYLDVRHEPPGLKKSIPELQIDLSAIAKGHGVDRVGKLLDKIGIQHYFVEIGGEIVARGTRLDGTPWRVGIESPQREERSVELILDLSDAAIATSGNYRNYFELDGEYYSHTIDPITGRPVNHDLASASVVAENCMLADAVATCMMVLGPNEGLKVANDRGWMVMLFCDDGGRLITTTSDKFSNRFPHLKHMSSNAE